MIPDPALTPKFSHEYGFVYAFALDNQATRYSLPFNVAVNIYMKSVHSIVNVYNASFLLFKILNEFSLTVRIQIREREYTS